MTSRVVFVLLSMHKWQSDTMHASKIQLRIKFDRPSAAGHVERGSAT